MESDCLRERAHIHWFEGGLCRRMPEAHVESLPCRHPFRPGGGLSRESGLSLTSLMAVGLMMAGPDYVFRGRRVPTRREMAQCHRSRLHAVVMVSWRRWSAACDVRDLAPRSAAVVPWPDEPAVLRQVRIGA